MTKQLTTLKEAGEYLLQYSPEKQSGETYTLGRMQTLMQRLGNPQNDIPAVHVAGTSGKTSTAYFIRALLEAHGKKTGLTASPHITAINERVQIGGMPLGEDAFLRYLNEFIAIITEWEDLQPTYFELLIAFAFWTFKQERVDYMVIEVGLGGLLDATNVITASNKVSVITPIGLDHTEILGQTLPAIARQKAGIIMANSQVFCAKQDPAALEVIQAVCRDTNSLLEVVSGQQGGATVAPLFQQVNFQLAKRAVDFIAERDSLGVLSSEDEAACLRQTPPGRFEEYTVNGKRIILDGAHNPQKLAALLESLTQRYPNESLAWLVGFISAPRYKIEDCLNQIIRSSDDYIFTDFTVGQDIKGRRSFDSSELLMLTSGRDVSAISETDADQALRLLMESKKRTVIVTGSLYLVARLRARIASLSSS